ncbi:MAG: hypothetical protein ACK5WR_24700 [Planctomycetaceae bacterium]
MRRKHGAGLDEWWEQQTLRIVVKLPGKFHRPPGMTAGIHQKRRQPQSCVVTG